MEGHKIDFQTQIGIGTTFPGFLDMKPAEEYILNQREPFRGILMDLQILVESTFPHADMQFKFGLPFHYLNGKPFCYFNASRKKGYVDLCLWNSAHLTLHGDKLIADGRKVIRSLRYYHRNEIEGSVVIDLLREAHAVQHKGFYKD